MTADFIRKLDWLAFLHCPIEGCSSRLAPGKESVSDEERFVQITSDISTHTEIIPDVEAQCKCGALAVPSIKSVSSMIGNATAEDIALEILNTDHMEVAPFEDIYLDNLREQIENIEVKQPTTRVPMIVSAVIDSKGAPMMVFTDNGWEPKSLEPFKINALISEENQIALGIPLAKGDVRYFVLEPEDNKEFYTLENHSGDRDFVEKMRELELVAESTDYSIDRARNVLFHYFPNARLLRPDEIERLNLE